MYQCLKNFDCIKDWIIGNILWAVASTIIIYIFFKLLPQFTEAVKITRAILKNNRDTRGNGLGKYSADRFMDIWYSSKKSPLRYGGPEFYQKKFGQNSRHSQFVIDDELLNLGLIEKFDFKRFNALTPVRNFKNNLVAKMTKYYLVNFTQDNPQYYRDLEQQSLK